MLLVPWAIGCAVARRLAGQDLLLLVAMLMFFLAHTQLLTWLRLRLVAASDPGALGRARGLVLLLAGAGGVAILPLLTLDRLTALLALGAIAAALVVASMYLVYRRLDHGLAGQVLAPAGLALSAPAAYSVARGALDRTAVALWAVNVLFFLGAVFYVRLKIDALKRTASLVTPAARLRFAAPTLGIDLAILAAVPIALGFGSLSAWAVLAFVPTAAQTLAGVARLDRPARLKRVGILATAHSILFALLLIGLA
jgi:hypothetical protein